MQHAPRRAYIQSSTTVVDEFPKSLCIPPDYVLHIDLPRAFRPVPRNPGGDAIREVSGFCKQHSGILQVARELADVKQVTVSNDDRDKLERGV
jgi:hypothetical protein